MESRKRVAITITACVELEAASVHVTDLLKGKRKLSRSIERYLHRAILDHLQVLFLRKPALLVNGAMLKIETSAQVMGTDSPLSDAASVVKWPSQMTSTAATVDEG
jgi:hypothetical protein